ncbi:C39 family peptidase [Haloferula chungangensis]|uniref:C39 family peptidase n=1 Tax=Haloferula chungangensis TaxID=1048331 RepID=A0ABW2LAK4_9BACT
MKSTSLLVSVFFALALPCAAIPNSVIGPVFGANSPLNGQDLTDQVLGKKLWQGEGRLPGEWVDEGTVGSSAQAHLLARPKLFDREVLLLRSTEREGRLAQLEATFVDAGSFFGYFDDKLPEGLTRRQMEEEMAMRLAAKQEEFRAGYEETLASLRETISETADKPKPKVVRFGKGRMLRVEPEEWKKDGLLIRLFAAENRLIRLTISPEGEESDGWLAPGLEEESARARLARYQSSVSREKGAVHVEGIKTVPQGYKPYCGLNTLAMAARHLGMMLDEDWMAVAAGFQNTGSAGGSNMVKLYHAVAAEAGVSLDRSSKFDLATVRKSLENGLPVVVWRRFSHERNRLHDKFASDPEAILPDPAMVDESSTWPGDDAPLHASVITGYDALRNEIFFLESWSNHDRTRRMRVEEMAATTYLCFAFLP